MHIIIVKHERLLSIKKFVRGEVKKKIKKASLETREDKTYQGFPAKDVGMETQPVL